MIKKDIFYKKKWGCGGLGVFMDRGGGKIESVLLIETS